MATPIRVKLPQPGTAADTKPVVHEANGGLEGADRTSREMMAWRPNFGSPDSIINSAKPMADARSRDIAMNDGYANGAVALHQDNIVGAHYRLNAQPNIRALGLSDEYAEEFQDIVEARFNVYAESEDCWLDASGRNKLTGQVRLAIATFMLSGEVLATAEWIREFRRPFSSAVQMVSPDRLCNPDMGMDTQTLRRGVEMNFRGRPIAYWIRNGYVTDPWAPVWSWSRIPAEKPWGRKQVCHIVEQRLPDQTRGVADMVAVLKQMRMTKKFQDVTLQQAVVAATYAASIESELPSDQVFQALGAGATGTGQNPVESINQYLGNWMTQLAGYLDGAKNIAVDGVMMPHLFPGTKMNVKSLGTPGGVGDGFEQSLLRHIAASLGLSYEQFSRDYTKTNYSSARASMSETWKFMQSRKKLVADRFATFIYHLWLEEEINAGNIPLPPGKDASWFYEPMVKDALGSCTWIGASRGQVDELKETQAAMLRIKAGLSTYELEAARLGLDWRDLFKQREREDYLAKKYNLSFALDAQKSGAASTQQTLAEDNDANDAQEDADK